MYRALGTGNILTGDFVALYYNRDSKWFSMINGKGQRSDCHGSPTAKTGFSACGKWTECGSSVFRVYAKGKAIGATITDQDSIALLHPASDGNTFVHFLEESVVVSKCLLENSNNTLPSHRNAWNLCKEDVVEVTIYRA